MHITTIEAHPSEFHIYSGHFDRNWVTAIKRLPNAVWQKPRWVVAKHSTTLDQLRALFEPFGRVMINDVSAPEVSESAIKTKYPFLYSFQAKAAAKAATRGTFLFAHDVGTGKTLTSFAAALALKQNDPAIKSILIVCPVSVQLQWQKEISKWYGKDSKLIKGPASKRQELWNLPGEIKIVSFETLRQDLPNLNDTTIVLADEISKIKNRSKLHKVFADLGKKIKYKLACSGTPVSGRLEHYKNIMDFISPSWMSYKYFDNNYAVKGMITVRGGEQRLITVGYKNLEDFVARLDGFVDRVAMAEVAPNLPPLTFEWRVVEMTSTQKILVDELLKYAKEGENGILPIWQLLHCAADGTDVVHESQSEVLDALPMNMIPAEASPKIKEIGDVLEEIPETEKVIIFTQFTRFAKRIQAHLGATLITGDMTGEERAGIISKFCTDPAIRVLVATDCMSIGVSFSDVNYMIMADIPADISAFQQRAGRIHRIDSKMPKVVICLVSEGLEQDIQAILEEKAKLTEKLLEGNFDPASIRSKIEEKYGLKQGHL